MGQSHYIRVNSATVCIRNNELPVAKPGWQSGHAHTPPNFSFVLETFGFVVVLLALERQIEKLNPLSILLDASGVSNKTFN